MSNIKSNEKNYYFEKKFHKGLNGIYPKLLQQKLRVALNYIIFLYLFFPNLTIEYKRRRLQFNSSTIYLKIYGPGEKSVLYGSFIFQPNRIIKNGIDVTVIYGYRYNFEYDLNNVTIIWNFSPYQAIYMFKNCDAIKEIYLSDLEISDGMDMRNMFYGCSNLSFLDLSKLNLPSYIDTDDIFEGCLKLQYINLKSATISSELSGKILNLPSENLTIFSDNDTWRNSLPNNLEIICNNHLDQNQNENENKFEYYNNNSYIVYLNHSCQICQKNFFEIYIEKNQPLVNEPYILEDYNSYLNDNDYKQCFYYCKKCDIDIDISYVSSYINSYQIISDTIKNDIINASIYYIHDSDYKSRDIINNFINSNGIKTEIITQGKIESMNESIEDIIENILTKYSIEEINNEIDIKKIKDNLEIIFTSTFNQKQNEENNNITMDLGQCENILKTKYNISKNESLYILQIIYKEIGMKIPKVEYEIYYPLYNNSKMNLTKLDLTLCQGTKIGISISVSINDTLDKHNPHSDYYNNVCSKTPSGINYDITLKDRRKEFVNNNMSLCEENCELIDYNYTTKK